MSSRPVFIFLFVLGLSSTSCIEKEVRPDFDIMTADVDQVMDEWHEAAATADEATYFGHMHPRSVLLLVEHGFYDQHCIHFRMWIHVELRVILIAFVSAAIDELNLGNLD